jgi:hypothetical protein
MSRAASDPATGGRGDRRSGEFALAVETAVIDAWYARQEAAR